ncbi:AAA family ATPase, partial [candidate division GN15 bacterium]|nr:AAA family ATPase [candidate division GN15 bacterium]
GIKPQPIPLRVKVVLIGDSWVYRLLWKADEDFKKVFKVKAEFDTVMDYNRRNVTRYYEFIRRVVDDDALPGFDVSGMQAIVEYGRRLSSHRKKLTVRFTMLSDMIREAAYCAQQRRSKTVSRKDVERGIINRRNRVNLIEDKIQELFDSDVLMVDTSGTALGQINGLSVYNVGEYQFGRPVRITVNTSLGKGGVINIERDADLSGPLHNKGVGILSGYLRRMFAQDKPLVMSASISFEQSYTGVDGDSASSTEIYGILSSLSGKSIKQGIAVTGSVNQKGEIQPIGGVNEKIEGWYDVCKARRLSRSQGVIIPHQNVQDLLLRPDVIEAVKKGSFHIYPIKTISEGIEILTGVTGGEALARGGFTMGSILDLADQRLREMATAYNNFGRSDNDKEPSDGRNGKKRARKKSKKPK